jgi:opacity protein-like surface antigen
MGGAIKSVAVGLLLFATCASAQESGATVSASAGVTSVGSRTELTVSGSAGYRFNRIVGFEIEVTAIPTLKTPFPTGEVTIQSATPATLSGFTSIAIFPAPAYANPNGRAVFFTNNVRVELPTTATRLTPYFVAGGGVATVRHTADLTIPIAITQIPNGIPGRLLTQSTPVSASSTDVALTLGGGVAIKVASHFGIDGDLRFFRLMGSEDTNAGRFGVGVRYTF